MLWGLPLDRVPIFPTFDLLHPQSDRIEVPDPNSFPRCNSTTVSRARQAPTQTLGRQRPHKFRANMAQSVGTQKCSNVLGL